MSRLNHVLSLSDPAAARRLRVTFLPMRAGVNEEASMSFQTYASYRGYRIHVQIDRATTLCFNGGGRRYKVCWVISSLVNPEQEIASFPERLEFLSEREALKYAENRAHTFIDCMLSGKQDMPVRGELGRGRGRELDPG
ncbi:hypothetical protein [Paraburkholderia sp. DGU8]|uniref:hypothetical protein n=1 Tax=Paraburkholderia sp. DGU8 TaxID=3161997 RepID=UPI0034674DF1